jgi:adenine deaminase
MEKIIRAARGLDKADLVLKNGEIINVFTMKLEKADVAICEGKICGIGTYEGLEEVDISGKFVAPGFMDGHIHIESSLMMPAEFSKAVIVHGTTAVMTDPHEIANVCGTQGIDFMMEESVNLPLDIYFLLPSCVPSSSFDEGGAVLEASDLSPYYSNEKVLGLAELMDYPGTISADKKILDKIKDACGKTIDGHAPGLKGKNLCAYIAAGVMSDHECISIDEALERISLGMTVMIREGTAAKNLSSLIKLFEKPYCDCCILATDDKHPESLINEGHIDHIIRKAVKLGADPITAVKMATYNTARYFGLRKKGAVAPGYDADLVVLSDLNNVNVDMVYKNGILIAEKGEEIFSTNDKYNRYFNDEKSSLNHKNHKYYRIFNSFNMRTLSEEDFFINSSDNINKIRTISLVPGEIATKMEIMDYNQETNGISVENDVLKLAVIERHKDSGHIGLGFIHGYGLKRGAIASSVSHDAHNLIVIGTNEYDMCTAANMVRNMQGGLAVADGSFKEILPLSAAGLMSNLSASELAENMADIRHAAMSLGAAEGIDPFMTLAFVSLPVIPEVRLTTLGLVDVDSQSLISTFEQ